MDGLKTLTKSQSLSGWEIGGIALGKPLVEVATQMIGLGNKNLLSAGAKLLLGVPIALGFKGSIGKVAGASLIVSASDDLFSRFIGNISGSTDPQSAVQVVGGSNSNQGFLPNGVI